MAKKPRSATSYDYLIVGAGLFGAVFAQYMTERGRKCLVIEKRHAIGGNVYDERINGILVNKYGGHIFHTNDKRVWEYANKFAEFENYAHFVKAVNGNNVYSFPPNMNLYNQVYGSIMPSQAKMAIAKDAIKLDAPARNFEEQALSTIGRTLYELLYRGYTEKQWGVPAVELPSSIAKRIPIRYNWDDRYFDDIYQGVPRDGYTAWIGSMLDGIEIELGVDYHDEKRLDKIARRTVYTGQIDTLYGYKYGVLDYRSLRFDTMPMGGDYTGCATINFTNAAVPFTRIIEWKHFHRQKPENETIITYEYPQAWMDGMEPYYPINNADNEKKAARYKANAVMDGIIVGGRLAEYRYYNMDQVIASALVIAEREYGN